MDKGKLIRYLQTVYTMPDEKARELTSHFVYFEFSKGTLLLEENKVNRQSFFLEEGYVRAFTLDKEGKEVTTKIYSAVSFVNDFLAFFKQQPAKENFQTLTLCRGWSISLDNVEKNFRDYPEFREFGRLLVLHHYEMLNERMLEMIKDSAETRYLRLLSKHPDIFQNVSLKIIASYLGITDTSLSRIRKEILQK
jgi:CRP-like cAMP-binding protein